MPSPITVSTDIADLLDSADKASARTALNVDVAGTAAAIVDNTAYNEATWNGVTGYAPSKDAVRDKFVSVDAAIATKANALGEDDNYVTDAEKTKLSNLSGTNTGDETTLRVTTLLQGAEADPTRIGAEYLPDALSGEGDPSGLIEITANFGDGSETIELFFDGVAGDDIFWSSDGESSAPGSGEWYFAQYLDGSGSTIGKFTDGVAGGYFTGTGDIEPADVVTWTPTAPATGTATFTETAAASASHIGQLYLNTVTGAWWRWDGDAWVEDAAIEGFVPGAGTLTGPASNLTIGTAAGAATGDFATANHTHTNAQVNTAIASDPAASREAMGAASSAIQSPAESLASAILVHDDMSGNNATYAAAATRTVAPGPGTMTAGAVPSTSNLRYENGELLLTPMPAGSGSVCAHWGAQTAAPGLTMIARFVPSWTPGRIAQTRVGFSDLTNTSRARRGHVLLTSHTAPYTQQDVRISTLASNVDDADYQLDSGTFEPGEEMAVAVHYKTLSHQQYWIQGGRYAEAGAVVGSDVWHLLGETFTALSGTVYPLISNTFHGTARVRDVQVLSSWTPSPRHQTFDYWRSGNGVHIPSFGRDPVTDLVVLGWNKSVNHVGANMSAIRYSTRLSDGTWTAVTDLIATPADGSGQCIQSISTVGSALWLIYWKQPSGLDGGVLYRRTMTVNSTTGAVTLGSEVEMGVTGTRNLSFSPILTLPSGRLLLPYHKNDGSPADNSYVSYSDDGGTTWTEGVIAASIPAGTTVLYEPTLVIESDGGVGVMMRTSANVAYYSRCTDPDASPLVWTTPAAVNAIPQPGANGSRMQFAKMPDGQILLVGSDSKESRRNLTVWTMGDAGTVIGKTRIADYNTIAAQGAYTVLMQYPVMIPDGDDLLIAYSHNHPGSVDVTMSVAIRLHTWRWTQVVAKEAGGSGFRSLPRPSGLNRRLIPAVVIAYSTTPTPDMSLGNVFDLRLTASTATVAAPLNPLPYETLTLVVTQAGSGSYTLAFNAVFEFNGVTTTLQTAVNASNIFVFRYNGFTNKWVLESFA